MNIEKEIEILREKGLTNREIAKKLSIKISLFPDKEKFKQYRKDRLKRLKCQPYYYLKLKIEKFKKKNGNFPLKNFDYLDVLEKFGEAPICYLTGKEIDLSKGETYNLDHFIPASKGGTNELENLRICDKYANLAKNDLNIENLLDLCQKIISHHSFNI